MAKKVLLGNLWNQKGVDTSVFEKKAGPAS